MISLLTHDKSFTLSNDISLFWVNDGKWQQSISNCPGVLAFFYISMNEIITDKSIYSTENKFPM